MLVPIRIGTMTILNGNNDSDDFDVEAGIRESSSKGIRDAAFAIAGPSALDGVCVLKVQREDALFVDFQSGDPPADITIPALKAIPLSFMPFRTLRMVSDAGGGETADRVFEVWLV